jgi:hypothetical protein
MHDLGRDFLAQSQSLNNLNCFGLRDTSPGQSSGYFFFRPPTRQKFLGQLDV